MIGFLLGFLAGYAVMYWRHAAQVRETNRVLEMTLAGLKAQRLPVCAGLRDGGVGHEAEQWHKSR